VCGTPAERPADEVMIYCPNGACPARIFRGLEHFVSRGAMDIRGLGEQTAKLLLDRGLVHTVADLYALRKEQLLELEGFKEKSAQNLIDGIAESRERGLARLLFALGVRHVGENAAELLARHFGSMDRLRTASADEIEAVHGIGRTTAEALAAFFQAEANQKVVDDLVKHGLRTTEEQAKPAEGPLTGETWVVTGTLPSLSRTAATELIEGAGGRVTGTVTKKTSCVLVGEDAGSKLQKAQELGIPTVTEAELLERLAQPASGEATPPEPPVP
jgi:DNA ligase (NAD+)